MKDNNLPDIFERWKSRNKTEDARSRKDQSFFVTQKEIINSNYNLNINKYKEFSQDKKNYEPATQIFSEINNIEKKIIKELSELNKLLKK